MRVVVDGDVGGADQRIPVLVGNDEDDALVGVLQDVGVVFRVHARHDDVAALDVPHARADRRVADLAQHVADPGAGGVDQRRAR